jgi:hypothetical protein
MCIERSSEIKTSFSMEDVVYRACTRPAGAVQIVVSACSKESQVKRPMAENVFSYGQHPEKSKVFTWHSLIPKKRRLPFIPLTKRSIDIFLVAMV